MNATHYQVTITATTLGTARSYSFTADSAEEAVRMAKAEHTTDYGFLNVGQRIDSVKTWNFETKGWDDVAQEAAPKALDQMTDDEKNDEIRGMWADSNGGELPYFGFFGGGPASDKAKKYLRVLLAKHAGRREAELIRWMLNDVRNSGAVISRLDVNPAITILKAL